VLVAGDFFKVWPPWSARWGDGALPHNTDLSDNVLYYLPSRQYAAASIRAGRIPLWNPYILSGTPFLAGGESGVFSPLNILFYLVRAPVAFGYTAALQLFLAGLFFYLLMRELGVGLPGSLFGAVVFMLNGFFVVWLEMLNLVGVALWIPLVVLSVKRWIERRTPATVLAVTGLIAVQFLVGFLQMSMYLLMAAFGYAMFRAVRGPEPVTAKRIAWTLGGLSAMTLAGAALAGVQLLPHLELIVRCHRDVTPVSWALVNRDHLRHLVTLVRPDHFGSPVGHTYHGALNYTELCGYVGVVPLIVALAGARPRANAATPYFVSTAVVALLLYLETPLNSVLAYVIPGYRLGIGATRAISLFTFAVAALAAIGFEGLVAGGASRLPARRALGAIVFLLSLAELLRFGARHLTTVDESLVFPPAKAIDFLKGVPGPWRMMSTPGVFPPNSPMAYGLEDADGYESLFPRRYKEYLSLADETVSQDPSSHGVVLSRVDSPLLDPLNVRFVVTDQDLREEGLRLRYDDEVRIYERARALPRAFVVWRFRRFEGGPAVLAALRSAEFRPAEEALLEADPGLPRTDAAGQAQVTIVSHEPERVVVRAALSDPGLLVLADSYYPGWEARVDGRERPVLVADYVLRAVALERGDHQVEFVFRPRSFRRGRALSVISLLGLCAGALAWRSARIRGLLGYAR
jgi:membrane protein YfhO